MRNSDFRLVEQRACGTNLYALAALRAGRKAPRIVQVRDHAAIDSPPGDIPNVRALDFRADPDAPRAQNAAIVIRCEPLVRQVHRQLWIAIRQAYMRQSLRLRDRLQLAISIGHAHRAYMISFREQQFQNGAAIMQQPVRFGRDLHAFFHLQHTGRKQFRRTFNLHQAQPAGSYFAQPFQVAQCGDKDIVLPRHIEDRLVLTGTDVHSVDDESFDIHRGAHTSTSANSASLSNGFASFALQAQTPAGQRW